jgi:hypothetical protein
MSIATQITRISTAKEDLRTALNNRGAGIETAVSISDYAASATTLMDGFVNQTQGIVNNETTILADKYKGYTNLVTAVFTSSVNSIGANAFSGCTNLKTIDLSNSTARPSIGDNAFEGIDENYEIITTDLRISAWTGTYVAHTTTKNKRYIEIYAKDTANDDYEIYRKYGFANGVMSKKIPNINSEYVKAVILNGMTELITSAFTSVSYLREVVIGDGVTYIGDGAFKNRTYLTSVTIGNSLQTLYNSAFKGCTALQGIIHLPDSLTYCGDSAFYDCSGITALDFGNTRSTIPSLNGNLSTFIPSDKPIVVPDALVDSWKATEGWSSISGQIVSYSEYYQIPMPIDYKDEYKKLIERTATKIEVPSGTTILGGNIFYTCTGLTEINIPNTVETIGGYSMDRCYSLSKIYIPTSVNLIQGCAFRYCSGLTVINFGNQRDSIPSTTTTGGDVFLNASNNFKIVVPDALYQDWRADSYWGKSGLINKITRYSNWKTSADYDARIDIVEDNPRLVNQNNGNDSQGGEPDPGGGGDFD